MLHHYEIHVVTQVIADISRVSSAFSTHIPLMSWSFYRRCSDGLWLHFRGSLFSWARFAFQIGHCTRLSTEADLDPLGTTSFCCSTHVWHSSTRLERCSLRGVGSRFLPPSCHTDASRVPLTEIATSFAVQYSAPISLYLAHSTTPFFPLQSFFPLPPSSIRHTDF